MQHSFRFAVIADSHFHPQVSPHASGPVEAAWGSDAMFNQRNQLVVEQLNQLAPAFVIHLGDLCHPVPSSPAHQQANDVAHGVYAQLDADLYMVPGNHDIGDKPRPLSPVAPPSAPWIERHTDRWGPLYQSFSRGGCRFVLIDTPSMNTGTPREQAQWAWLDEQLSGHDERILVFMHYPAYLHQPFEPEHYDNLAEPARSRLVRLLQGAEAVFCGHVHHFFWSVLGAQTDQYIAPSTAFVRPGYAELSSIGPGGEHGRDNRCKLGFFVVDVSSDGVDVHFRRVHLEPEPGLFQPVPSPCPLGFTLRHDWNQTASVPCDGLDPFSRKTVTNDLAIAAVLELNPTRLRLPISDATDHRAMKRLAGLKRKGVDIRYFSVTPGPPELDAVVERVAAVGTDVPDTVPFAVVTKGGSKQSGRFSHFPTVGFLPNGDVPVNGVVRISPEHWPLDVEPQGNSAIVELPRATESTTFVDDTLVAHRCIEAWLLALKCPEYPVYLDAFVDHDRGYFTRHGLMDRRGDPRPAHRALLHLCRMPGLSCLPVDQIRVQALACVRRISLGAMGSILLPLSVVDAPPGVDLLTGQVVGASSTSSARWLPPDTALLARLVAS